MKLNKSILEAINRGIALALDDFEDDNQLSSKQNVIKNINTKELWNLYNNFVDLGLPSGTLWAKYNLGVDQNKLDSAKNWYGKLYAWGEIEEKENYYGIYKFKTKNGIITKYNKKDGLTELQLEDDAAYQTDNRMKMPTKKQFEELLEYTTNRWIENYQGIKDLNGRLLTSKINGEQMFIPASGFKYQLLHRNSGYECRLWSSSLFTDNITAANDFYFIPDYIGISLSQRHSGFPVRPVLNRN